jgi:ribosomal protein S18 acetylase RimI-like enzyme
MLVGSVIRTLGCHQMYDLRTARKEDLPKLAAVERRSSQLFADTPHAFLVGAPTLSMGILTQQHALGAVWVVTHDDEPVGFAVAGEHGGDGYLYEIDVDPAHGQRGLGRRLMDAAFEWARAAGYDTMTLSTFVDVPWNAPFYETLGFRTVPDADHTPAMIETRFFEAKAGFLVDRRVFMRRSLR